MSKFIKILEQLEGTNKQFDKFFHNYLVAALWSSTDDETPLDDNYSISDISKETLSKLKTIANSFYQEAYEMIKNDVDQAGHDFWLTQNGHGAGFWDGDWKEHGDALTVLAKKHKEVDLYVGDDGKLYI